MVNLSKVAVTVAISWLLLTALPGVGQSVAPPISEYRGKADGMYELRNDSDVAMAVIVEVQGFTVDEDGGMRYSVPNPQIKVDLGSNSFVIPPRQSHYVFYKAKTDEANGWFTIQNTMTRQVPLPNQMRINFVLPHVVYIYQKKKLTKNDLSLDVRPGEKAGEYTLTVSNLTPKLGRIQGVTCEGFEKKAEVGGFPVFPSGKRHIKLEPGKPVKAARIKVNFEDGFSLEAPIAFDQSVAQQGKTN